MALFCCEEDDLSKTSFLLSRRISIANRSFTDNQTDKN
jgi:hypothetical protein